MIRFTTRLDKAISKAAWAHEQQGEHRKGTDIPYIIHPFGVMLIAGTVTEDEDTLIACLLHDILEDVDPGIYDASDIEKDFGSEVLGIVKDVTKDEAIKDWHKQGRAYLYHLDNYGSDKALLVCAADKIHNLSAIITDYKQVGESLWSRFTTAQAKDQIWWYESVLEILNRRAPDLPLTSRLEKVLAEMKQLRRQAAIGFLTSPVK